MTRRRVRAAPSALPPPTVTDLVLAPELAAIILLEHALGVAAHALLAQHPTVIDDFERARDDAPVLALAHRICLRARALEDVLRRYRHAVADLARVHAADHRQEDLPF